MEIESRRFYEAAAQQTTDAGIRQLLGDLAQEEQRHEDTAEEITDAQAKSGALSQSAKSPAGCLCCALSSRDWPG